MNTNTDTDVEAARAAMVREVVEAMSEAGEALSHETVAAKLPPDFQYDEVADDYEAHIGEMTATESTDGASSEKPKVSSHEVLRQRVRDLDQACADGRANIVNLQAQLARARGKMADALQAWHTGSRKITPEMNARAYIKSEQEQRARLRECGPTISTESQPGNSYIDRAAFHSKGGDANDAVRGQLRRGYRRGSLSAAHRGMKLPSGV